MAPHDLFSGKPRDRASDNLPGSLAEVCEDCGTCTCDDDEELADDR